MLLILHVLTALSSSEVGQSHTTRVVCYGSERMQMGLNPGSDEAF